MGRKSAGLLMYRFKEKALEVLLVHPGGPYWRAKESGCWSIPKGECLDNEEPFEAAKREFLEETGLTPVGQFYLLTEVKQAGGKRVKAWAFAGDCDPATLQSNTFTMEWPPRSGQMQTFPEVDRAGWFPLAEAKRRIVGAQSAFLDELERLLSKQP
jgi:predicted NUDIX family NTP pyrophosphohydrolase